MAHAHNHHLQHAEVPEGRVKDPVCGMWVDPLNTAHRSQAGGEGENYFCSAGCRTKFEADPSKYLHPAPAAAAPQAPAGTIYTCPMHPDVRQEGPGACPICGMALESETVTAETGPNPELADFTRRFWAGLAFTAPVFVLDMGGHVAGLTFGLIPGASAWIQFILAAPVVLWSGWPFLERGARSLATRHLNMFTLIALGVSVSFTYSVAALMAPQLFPPAVRGHGGLPPVYFEAAAVITVLALLGQVLELRAREQTSGAIRALLDLAPKTARRVRDGAPDEDAPLDQVQVGDRLRVRPGEKVPVDGEVVEGQAAVDESLLTGEAMPATKTAGDKVIGGAITRTGSFIMRAEKIGSDTLLAQIVQLVA